MVYLESFRESDPLRLTRGWELGNDKNHFLDVCVFTFSPSNSEIMNKILKVITAVLCMCLLTSIIIIRSDSRSRLSCYLQTFHVHNYKEQLTNYTKQLLNLRKTLRECRRGKHNTEATKLKVEGEGPREVVTTVKLANIENLKPSLANEKQEESQRESIKQFVKRMKDLYFERRLTLHNACCKKGTCWFNEHRAHPIDLVCHKYKVNYDCSYTRGSTICQSYD